MAIPAIVSHDGALAGQAAPGGPAGALQELLRTQFSATYGASKSARPSIVGATDAIPFTVPLETMTKVRMLALRVRGGSLKLRVTSAVGTDQSINVGDLFMWHGPNSGDELTAIKLVGTADCEYVIAGDTA